jgi:acyl-CoA reductase-like NAD-dependent aldehyde dehydrogenase
MVLPSNSPGVHTLWMPILPLQVGLVMKPGSQEPWTPWRMSQALIAAGIPEAAIGLYPGGHDVGGAIMASCDRSLIFGGPATIEQYAGDPRVQVHGPGFSKILLGDDVVDDWEQYLDMMVESVLVNGGRSCINCSSIWASRHTQEIAAALAERLGPIQALPHDDPQAAIAAFTVPGQARAISEQIDSMLAAPSVQEATAATRDGERLIDHDRYGFVRPTVVHCDAPDAPLANSEYMFPFVSVVQCPQEQMLRHIGYTLVGTAITNDEPWQAQLLDSSHIDRLNFGPVPTTKLNWLQPHEGNIVDFLYRARAFQKA